MQTQASERSMQFMPVIGSWVSGFVGILFALTQGWQTALIYAIFVSLVQGGIDGQILAPRVFGKVVGLNPMILLLALLAVAQLFGMMGALLGVGVILLRGGSPKAVGATFMTPNTHQPKRSKQAESLVEVID